MNSIILLLEKSQDANMSNGINLLSKWHMLYPALPQPGHTHSPEKE